MKQAIFALLSLAFAVMSHAETYRFPDEWADREGTMMIFPAKHQYGRATRDLQGEFVALAKAIAANEKVWVFCPFSEKKRCERLLGGVENVQIRVGDFDIDWARDNAPMLVKTDDGALMSAGFRANGWGKKYRGWQRDAATRDNIAKEMGWPIVHSDLVLEGGAIEIAGGVGIVTESCVLNRNRTTWLKAKVTAELKRLLGLKKVIWIKSGLMPDPITDGHVDGLLKWVAEDKVLLHMVEDESDENYQICRDAKRILKVEGIEVAELPLVGDFVHMSYYIGSGGKTAYVPVSGDKVVDDPALRVIAQFYKKVVPIKAVAIAEAGGGIHCYTQQIPSRD